MITAAQSALNAVRATRNASYAKSRLLLIGQNRHCDAALRASLSRLGALHDIPRHPAARIIGRADEILARLETLSQRTVESIGGQK